MTVLNYSIFYFNKLLINNYRKFIITVFLFTVILGLFYSRIDLSGLSYDLGIEKAEAAAPSDNWWNNNYLYRRKITITAGTIDVPNQYTVTLTFDHSSYVAAGQSLTNGNDVRIVYWNGSTWNQIDRLLAEQSEWNNVATRIWFRTQTTLPANTSDDNYYMYYGNSSPDTPPTNWQNVLLFYDTFSSAPLDTNRWTCVAATCDISGGSLNLSYSGRVYATSTYAQGVNTRWEARMRIESATANADLFLGSDEDLVSEDLTDYAGFYRYDQTFVENGTNGYLGDVTSTEINPPALNTAQLFAFERIGTDTIRYYSNTNLIATHTDPDTIPPGDLRVLINRLNTNIIVEYVLIRRYITSEPTASINTILEHRNLRQNNFRFFENANSTDVGAPLVAQNTTANISATPNTQFRLRQILSFSGSQPINTGSYKLQFASRVGTCDTGFVGETYTDVSPSAGNIRFFDNTTPADNVALTSNANDPTATGTIRNQSYEESNNFTNSAEAIGVSENGLWDFSLVNFSASNGESYCFRVVYSDNTLLSGYDFIPEITVGSTGTLDVSIVNSSGDIVANPNFVMDSLSTSFNCQDSYGLLGDNNQRIRVSNTTSSAPWTLTLTATDGPTANWSSGTNSYDYNDIDVCTDSDDPDSVAGALILEPASSNITPQAGCNSDGVSAGSFSFFSKGVVDSVTLATASGSAQTNCYWEITGVILHQVVPQIVPPGSYSINLTLSVTAS